MDLFGNTQVFRQSGTLAACRRTHLYNWNRRRSSHTAFTRRALSGTHYDAPVASYKQAMNSRITLASSSIHILTTGGVYRTPGTKRDAAHQGGTTLWNHECAQCRLDARCTRVCTASADTRLFRQTTGSVLSHPTPTITGHPLSTLRAPSRPHLKQ